MLRGSTLGHIVAECCFESQSLTGCKGPRYGLEVAIGTRSYRQGSETFDGWPRVSESITQENADGYNNYIGNDGDIVNGNADDQD